MEKKGNQEKESLLKQMEEKEKKVKKVLAEWKAEDDGPFRWCVKAACDEVRKIAQEYLAGGYLENVPHNLFDLRADNIFHETQFSATSKIDTHANHLSTTYHSKVTSCGVKTSWELNRPLFSRMNHLSLFARCHGEN